jgi:hypothetical protein
VLQDRQDPLLELILPLGVRSLEEYCRSEKAAEEVDWGFWADSAETGSGSLWVGADGLVIGVGFGDCYGLKLTGLLFFFFFFFLLFKIYIFWLICERGVVGCGCGRETEEDVD